MSQDIKKGINRNINKKKLRITAYLACMIIAGGIVISILVSDDESTPTITREDAQAVVDNLAAAYQVQGVCYGWSLSITNFARSGERVESVGSNFGTGIELVDIPETVECEGRVRLTAQVTWTSEQSESEDSGSLRIDTEPNAALGPLLTSQLADLGVTVHALIDDPIEVWAQAMLALPLLMTENGAFEPVPPVISPPSSAITAPEVGSDWWRRHGMTSTIAVVCFVLALLCVWLGVLAGRWDRHNQDTNSKRRASGRSTRQSSAVEKTEAPVEKTE